MKKIASAVFATIGFASVVCAESTLTISPDGATLDGASLPGGKLAVDTQVDFLNANGGTLDLNGHSLTFSSAYASRFSVTAQTVITNSSETTATSAFRLTSASSQFSSEFQSMRFGGNLKLVVAGRASSNAGFQTAVNSHTGGTELDGYFNVNETTMPQYSANQHPRFSTDSAFGTGPLTLKNGTAISYTGGNCIFPWAYISVEGGTNQFRCPNATASFLNPLKVASGSTLMWCSERQGNLGQTWTGDMSEVLGTLLVNGRAGTFLAVNEDIPGTVALGASAGAQLQYRGSDGTFEVGALETQDLTAYSANAFLQNAAGLKTLKVGAANKDTVFYGNIACTGSKAAKDWKLEKTGTGTLTLAGTNTYLSTTIISGGTLKLAGVGTLGAPDSTADVQFAGGTLEYGDGATADYSGRIKSSTAPISIDTGTNSIVFATALAASNEGGLVKKGDGVLVLEAKPNHSGKTIVSNGTLKIAGAYEYSSADGISSDIRDSFEVSNGANLEVTFRSTAAVHAGEAGVLTGLPNGTTVNFENADYRGMPRLGNVTTFSGTVNFLNSLDNSGDLGAGGLVVNGATNLGSAEIDWGVIGEPVAEHTRIFDIFGSNGMVVDFGALRQTSPNAMIHSRHRCEINIGSLGTNSVINGQFEMSDNNLLTLNSVGGRLTLGESFAVLAGGAEAYTRTPILNVTAGEIVNNADLSSFTVNLSDGVTVGGSGTWPAGMAMPGAYSIAASTRETTCLNGATIDFGNGASLDLDLDGCDPGDKSVVYQVVSASSISGLPDTSFLAPINEGRKGGEWVLSVRRGETHVLVLRWRVKNGFMIRFH